MHPAAPSFWLADVADLQAKGQAIKGRWAALAAADNCSQQNQQEGWDGGGCWLGTKCESGVSLYESGSPDLE
jgi:hypothetical protein